VKEGCEIVWLPSPPLVSLIKQSCQSFKHERGGGGGGGKKRKRGRKKRVFTNSQGSHLLSAFDSPDIACDPEGPEKGKKKKGKKEGRPSSSHCPHLGNSDIPLLLYPSRRLGARRRGKKRREGGKGGRWIAHIRKLSYFIMRLRAIKEKREEKKKGGEKGGGEAPRKTGRRTLLQIFHLNSEKRGEGKKGGEGRRKKDRTKISVFGTFIAAEGGEKREENGSYGSLQSLSLAARPIVHHDSRRQPCKKKKKKEKKRERGDVCALKDFSFVLLASAGIVALLLCAESECEREEGKRKGEERPGHILDCRRYKSDHCERSLPVLPRAVGGKRGGGGGGGKGLGGSGGMPLAVVASEATTGQEEKKKGGGEVLPTRVFFPHIRTPQKKKKKGETALPLPLRHHLPH